LFKSDIKEIETLSQAQEELAVADDKTLVVFDMDDTLIVPTEKMFYLLYKKNEDFDPSDVDFVKLLRDDFRKIATSKNDPEYLNKLSSAVYAKTIFTPVEERTVSTIKDLQNKDVNVIVLTSSNTGKFFSIENMQQWREHNLNQIGLDFSKSFDQQEIIFENFDKQFGFYPVFYKGILCAAGNPKGKVLATFLDKMGKKIDKVIFFDDIYHHCQSVDSEMKKRSIPIQCYWYKAACKNKIKLNQKVVKAQFDYWIAHEEFLTEEEALRMNGNGEK
jgi:hypothetical protein